jgi:flotillin
VDVAEAKLKGDVGAKEREGLTRKETSRIEAQSYLYEVQRQIEKTVASTEFQIQQADYDRQVRLSQIEAEKATEIRETELKRSIEAKRLELETERLRAQELAQAIVDFESAVKNADSKLYALQREAQGVEAMYAAQAEGINKLVEAFDGDPEAALEYMMLEQGMFEDLARTNAFAIKGLAPNITVWNTTSGSELIR